MKTLLAVLATLVRLVLPARGLHAAPRGTANLFQADEARERVPAPQTTRVQADGNGADRVPQTTRVQADGNGADCVPVPQTAAQEAEEPRASLVRPYLVHWEREQERARVERSRLGMAVLLDIATEVSR